MPLLLAAESTTTAEMWENVAKVAALPLLLWLANRYYTRHDKKNDEARAEEKAAIKARNEKADAEREGMKEEIKRMAGRLEMHEQRLTAFQLTDEKLGNELADVKRNLDTVAHLASRNEMNIGVVRDSLARVEGQVATVIQRLMER